MATSHGTPRARGPQLVHVHGLEVTEPALDLLLADGRELDGELEPAYCSVRCRIDAAAASRRWEALGLNDNEKLNIISRSVIEGSSQRKK